MTGRVAPVQMVDCSPWSVLWDEPGTIPPEAALPKGLERVPASSHLLFRLRGRLGPDTYFHLDQTDGEVRCSTCRRVGVRSVLVDWFDVFLLHGIRIARVSLRLRKAVSAGKAMNAPADARRGRCASASTAPSRPRASSGK